MIRQYHSSGIYADTMLRRTETHTFKGHDRWFRTAERRDAYTAHRNLQNRARRAGYNPSNPIDLESFRLWEESMRDSLKSGLVNDAEKIVRLRHLIKQNVTTHEFIRQTIAIVEGDTHD